MKFSLNSFYFSYTETFSSFFLNSKFFPETPELPTVIFGSPSYVLRADMAQTGVIGRVSAAATNGESIAYALTVSDGKQL